MTDEDTIELFILKCAVIEGSLDRTTLDNNHDLNLGGDIFDEKIDIYIRQFQISNQNNATKMARYYRVFYMLENDIRSFISEAMESAHGSDWWTAHAPQAVREEATRNRAREEAAGISSRSDSEIDYITFGQLYDIIKDNWTVFAGMFSNQAAVNRVLSGLNMLRGTIAHCGVLADDEVDRLKLAIKDWFRVIRGPQS
jgi:thiamine pyrophosphate-dependent acetolactate synthase large subunit-like protein